MSTGSLAIFWPNPVAKWPLEQCFTLFLSFFFHPANTCLVTSILVQKNHENMKKWVQKYFFEQMPTFYRLTVEWYEASENTKCIFISYYFVCSFCFQDLLVWEAQISNARSNNNESHEKYCYKFLNNFFWISC